MNDETKRMLDEIPPYQLRAFQDLMADMAQCCKERSQFQAERFGLPEAELRCLMLFADQRYLTSKEIARRMNVAKSRVSKVVTGLTARDLVRRTPDPEDSRVSLLSLTSEGQRLLDQVTDYAREMSRVILEFIPLGQRTSILDSLGALRTSMKTARDLLE
jgi:DNA-binding MarR family transcriptional regulator